MSTFELDLDRLRNIDWSGNFSEEIDLSLLNIISRPEDFATFVANVFIDERKELVQQVQGVLYFLVYRYPEIYILIQMYLIDRANSRLKSLLDTYSLYIIEN